MAGGRRERKKEFTDPWLESIFSSPDKKAKLHIAITIGYIIFIVLMFTGIMVVILTAFDLF